MINCDRWTIPADNVHQIMDHLYLTIHVCHWHLCIIVIITHHHGNA